MHDASILYFREYSNICSGQYYVICYEKYLFGSVLCYISGHILISVQVGTILYFWKHSKISLDQNGTLESGQAGTRVTSY